MHNKLLKRETWLRVIEMERIGSKKDVDKESLFTGKFSDDDRLPLRINNIRIALMLLTVVVIAVDFSFNLLNVMLFMLGLLLVFLPNIMMIILKE